MNKVEVVLWKPKFSRRNKCKSSNYFAEWFDEVLRPLADNMSHSSCAMTEAMVLPHLILKRTKKGTDSVNKSVIRRLRQWNKGKLDELLAEAKRLQVRKSSGSERQLQTLKSLPFS